MRRWISMAPALALVWACDSPQESPTSPEPTLTATSDILDATMDGTDGFYFIPPMAPNPDETGTPNMDLSPAVRICPIDDVSLEPDCSGPAVVEFESDEIERDTDHYHVSWDTKRNDEGGYRVYVVHEGADPQGNPQELEMGYRDIWGCGRSCDVPPGDYYVFNAASTVPVKFRMEGGVLCGLQTLGGAFVDCVEGVLGSTQVITPEYKAGVIVCDGDVGDPNTSCNPSDLTQTVTILVYRDVDEFDPTDNDPTRCIDGLDMPQGADADSGCYRVRVLTPGFSQIEPGKRAFVTLCVDEHSFPGGGTFPEEQEEAMIMFKEGNDGSIQALNTVASQLGCQGNTPVALAPLPQSTPWTRLASAGLDLARRALSWIAPQPLLAMLDNGRGGELDTFSLFTVALTGTYEKAAGDGIVAPPGAVISPSPGVTVTSTDALSVDFGVPGARVRFVIPDASTDGAVICEGGTCATDGQGELIVFTDADGIATLDSWTLGNANGTYLVDASVTGACPVDNPTCPGDGSDYVRFVATVCAPNSGIGAATVDAVIDPTEWQCAYSQPFQANLSGGSSIPAEWKWMTDGTNLYIAVVVDRDADDKLNVLRLDFDDNGDLNPDAGDNVIEIDADASGPNGQLVDKHLTQKCVNSNQSGCGELDAVQHGLGAFGNDGTKSYYELSFPLDTGDGQDFDAAAGLRGFLTLGIGNGAQGNTQVPDFRDYSCVLIPGPGGVPAIGGCAIP